MGTRSLTRIHDGMSDHDEILVNMYRQMDGYPDGHGSEIAECLDGRTVGNGINLTNPEARYSNGPGCFAAQLISHFKDENIAGHCYLYPVNARDCWEAFVYDIYADHDKPVRVKISTAYGGEDEVIFNGNVEDFKTFCKNPPTTEDGDYIPFVSEPSETKEEENE